ncbi:MAG: DNA mismatch repair protein MutS, partial [Lutibacter sp.]
MQQPLEFYTAEKARFEQEHKTLKKQLALSSSLRLLVFLMAVAGIYIFFGNVKIMIYTVVISAILFIFLLTKHTKLQYKSDLNKALIDINNTEIKVLNRDYFSLDPGIEFINPEHPFSYDIDLFGKGSFFQYANRTVTNEGRREF